MARKGKEKEQAKTLFIELGKSQKEIAATLGVSENTISKWATRENWKAARTARMTSTENMLLNGKMAIANLSDIMLDLQKQRAEFVRAGDKPSIAATDASILGIADAIAKTGSNINKFEKNNAISLVTYFNVMDSIFKALQNENPKLHAQTLDFQERHVQEVAKILG